MSCARPPNGPSRPRDLIATERAQRSVFLGTSAFAASVLQELIEMGISPALVITRPDRPRGRGRRLAAPAVAEVARRQGLALLQPEDVNAPASVSAIAAVAPEAVCVCAFGALIREPLLSAQLLLNVHPSLLPRWRGAAPVERSIMAGDVRTGVSIMRVDAGLDSGPVCLVGEEAIGPGDTYGTLAPRLQRLGAQLLARALSERPPFIEQDEAGVSYAEKITAADRLLDPASPAAHLERVVRALHPHIGARMALTPELLVNVHRARLCTERPAGEVGSVATTDGRLRIACSEDTLELLVVQPSGGRAMPVADFLRGHPNL